MIEIRQHRPTWAEINLDNLAFNFRSVKKFIGENIKFMAVVKADAYGHGALKCAQRLETENIDWLGVALPEEGVILRENRITKPILCLGSLWNGQEDLLLKYKLTPVVYQLEIAEKFNRAAKEKRLVADIHIKVDTGMGRIGVRFDEVKVLLEGLKKLKNLRIDGLMTHFASADDLNQNDFTNLQIERFNDVVKIFEEDKIYPAYKNLANSPGAVGHKNSLGNMARLGGVLYGLGGDVLPEGIDKPDLKPVLSLHSQIAHIKRVSKGESLGYSRTFKTTRDSLIATIPIGYHDGYRRGFSNKSRVLVNGTFAPVVGRISMDWTILDVTDAPDIKLGDEVVLIGERNGFCIKAEELAGLLNTISYEITCAVNQRVIRKYIGG